jgi:DNA invertase Pin-like site-specific DNA recombinase
MHLVPPLAERLSDARRGDTFVVGRLDRVGGLLPHLIEIMQKLKADGVG